MSFNGNTRFAEPMSRLIEELRRDMPNVRNRHDPDAAVLQQSMNPDQVLAALDELSEPEERLKLAGEGKAAVARK